MLLLQNACLCPSVDHGFVYFLANAGNKAVDFQIRVKLVEGRQLSGGNVSPTVQVAIANQSKKSKVVKSTNAPSFHETFFFNFNQVPNRLFEEMIDIRVYDSKV